MLVLKNDLLGYRYVEPFAGGAGAALSLLFDEYVDEVHLNDLDAGVASFWRSVLYESERFIDTLMTTDVGMDQWYRQKDKQSASNVSDFELGFSTFFLNRTNRSGIIGGGPIGGPSQNGRWSLGARFNKEDLAKRISKIARFRSRIVVTQMDALDLLRSICMDTPAKTFIYADPPYYQRGQTLYPNHYEAGDHAEISEQVKQLPCPWVVSYDAVPQAFALFEGVAHISYSLSYSASTRERGREVMFFSGDLRAPDIESPANIYRSVVDEARLSRLAQQRRALA